MSPLRCPPLRLRPATGNAPGDELVEDPCRFEAVEFVVIEAEHFAQHLVGL